MSLVHKDLFAAGISEQERVRHMCLAIPAQITELKEGMIATISIMGLTRDVNIRLTPDAVVGDYVLVHAGFAINIIDETEALETLKLIEQFPELAQDETDGLQGRLEHMNAPVQEG